MIQAFSLGVAALLLLAVYHIASLLQSRHTRSRRIKELGCKEPPKYPHKDPIFGLDLFFDNVRAVKNHRLLETIKQRYEKHGQTFQALAMGKVSIHTNDPRNFQAVHSTSFYDYGVQPIRRAPTLPFLGEGVFTMDGAFWEHSRAMLRPTFTRCNVADLPTFEVHFQKFLKLVPTNGSTVDLKPLLYRLVSESGARLDMRLTYLVPRYVHRVSLWSIYERSLP